MSARYGPRVRDRAEIIRFRRAVSFVNSWLSNAGEIASRIQKLADGRQISVARRIMADGGLVVTHEDITERERLNARLEEQHELLKTQEEKLRLQNLQLDAALNNMVQGLAMYDADQRLALATQFRLLLQGAGGAGLERLLNFVPMLSVQFGRAFLGGQ